MMEEILNVLSFAFEGLILQGQDLSTSVQYNLGITTVEKCSLTVAVVI